MSEEIAKCKLCGDPMPEGEQMFYYHGYSGPCPKPPLPPVTAREDQRAREAAAQKIVWRIREEIADGGADDRGLTNEEIVARLRPDFAAYVQLCIQATEDQPRPTPPIARIIPTWAQEIIANPAASADELRRAYAAEITIPEVQGEAPQHEHFWRTVERNGQWITECESCGGAHPASEKGK